MAKTKTPSEERFTDQDFNLFEALQALDRKDYGYYRRLTDEQRRKFNPYMLVKYLSSSTGRTEIQQFHVLSTNEIANTHLFNEFVGLHSELQWLMLCAASLGQGRQFHAWIPQIREAVVKLRDRATKKEIQEYFTKTYSKAASETVTEIAELYIAQQHRRCYLAEQFPDLKLDDIAVLADAVTDEDIEQYEKAQGN